MSNSSRRFLSDTSRSRTAWLALLSAAVFWFLSHNHTFVPMWVEGMGECLGTELIMFGYEPPPANCWFQIGPLNLPLALNPHIGPAWFYAYAPAMYLWFNKVTADPYVYRYTGIVFFIVSAWLLYYLVRNYYTPSISFYASAAFLTNPLFLLGSMTDYELINIMPMFMLLTAYLFSRYIKGGGVAFLLASALSLGVTLLTRVETAAWLAISLAVYVVVARPALILDRWRQTPRKPVVILLAVALFCLGAAPMIAFNLTCTESNIFSFTATSVIPRSFSSGSKSVWESLGVRIAQHWRFNLLNVWPMFELRAANYPMAFLWVLSVCILVVRWIGRRHSSFLLVMVPTIIVLSTLTSSSLKNEHLNIAEPLAIAVITSGLASLAAVPSLRKWVHLAFILLIAGNLTVTTLNWLAWNNMPANTQTMLNQSDPLLLTGYLSEHHADDRILYTNVGMKQYVGYLTVGTIKGEEIMDWVSVDGFIQSVRLALVNKDRRRVFVAVSRDHDGLAGSTRRTKLLYDLLDSYQVPYGVTHLANHRNSSLYDLIVVEQGATLSQESATAESLLVSDVVDVHVYTQPNGERRVIGSVLGNGFVQGDMVRVNEGSIVQTTFGNSGWITFSIPLEVLGNRNSFTLEVVRVGTSERSRKLTATFEQ